MAHCLALTLMTFLLLVAAGCSGGGQSAEQTVAPTATASPSIPVVVAQAASLRDVLQILPDHVAAVTHDDLAGLLEDSELKSLARERHLDYWGDRLENLGIFFEDIATLTGPVAGESGDLLVLTGDLDAEGI